MLFVIKLLSLIAVFLTVGCFNLELSERIDGGNSDDNGNTDETGDETEDEKPVENPDPENPCSNHVCDRPSQTECNDTSDGLVLYFKNAYCDLKDGADPTCFYSATVETCLSNQCVDGVCVEEPCQGVVCDEPPASSCDQDSGHLVYYSLPGVCVSDGTDTECIYEPVTWECENGCQDGVCIDTVCDGKSCVTPPARYCSGELDLIVFSPIGRCSESGSCVYTRNRINCKNGCQPGRCVGEIVCRRLSCAIPPANFCLDSQTLYAYKRPGICRDGGCAYDAEQISCSGPCEDGKCKEDPCIGIECYLPPAPMCTGDGNLRIWDGNAFGETFDTPLCVDGACVYQTEENACGQDGCSAGRCVKDPCSGMQFYCDSLTPLADYCAEGISSVTYNRNGACEGDGFCVYRQSVNRCDSACQWGRCLE
jgi:hypothetical protein